MFPTGGPGAGTRSCTWGSTVALELFHRHPGAVTSLILTGAYAGWKGSLPADEVAARIAGVQRMLDAPPEHFDPELPGLFAGEPPASVVPLLQAMAAEIRRHSMRTALSIMAATDVNFVLPTISVPTLLVWGEFDVRSPMRIAHDFEQAIPNATLVVIPECGHVTNLDRPDDFNRRVREFCHRHVRLATEHRSDPAVLATTCAATPPRVAGVAVATPRPNRRHLASLGPER